MSPQTTARHGYIGQLTKVASFAVITSTNTLDEDDSLYISGVATLDDDTALAVEGSEVTWGPAVYPLSDISDSGLAAATNVYQDTTAFVTGLYLNITGTDSFLVINVNDDNFGSYAGDGLPDDWQVGYFGIGNPEAGATNDMDLDSADNTAEWVADTIPTDSGSYFHITQVTAASNNANIYFDSSASRIYSLEFTTNLTPVAWSGVNNLTNQPGVGGELCLTQTNLPSGQRFYCVTVALP